MEAMERDLQTVRNASALPAPICLAAIAALLVLSKYYVLTDDNEVYRIALGLSYFEVMIICLTFDSSYVPQQEVEVV
jgi:hypothetical protein